MFLWMYATRIPAMIKAKVKLDPTIPKAEAMANIPANVRWKADNYNHLMEQPTIFYPLAISLALLDAGTGMNLYFAWAYVILRIMHSLVQALVNKIKLRFFLFILSNVALFGMTINGLMVILK